MLSATTTAEDLKRSAVLREVVGELAPFVDLICSEPIRQRATIGGNIVNASPIGDLTIMLLALDAELGLARDGVRRELPLREFFRGYKQLDLAAGRDRRVRPLPGRRGHAVASTSRRSPSARYLDIASVNSAAWLRLERRPHRRRPSCPPAAWRRSRCGCSPPRPSCAGKRVTAELARRAADIARAEIAPISDVRGSADYKRLLLGQLVLAHFHVLFGIERSRAGGGLR